MTHGANFSILLWLTPHDFTHYSLKTFSHKWVRKNSIAKYKINNTVDTDSNLVKEKHVSLRQKAYTPLETLDFTIRIGNTLTFLY